MILSKCPGQDTRYWTPEDIHEQPCPHCGKLIEFWKTDIRVRCPNCKQKVANPRFNLGCAEWCAYAEQCLGSAARGTAPQPLRKILEQELSRLGSGLPLQLKVIREKMEETEHKCREEKTDPLPFLTALVALGARELGRLEDEERFFKTLREQYQFPEEALQDAISILKNMPDQGLWGDPERFLAGILGGTSVFEEN